MMHLSKLITAITSRSSRPTSGVPPAMHVLLKSYLSDFILINLRLLCL